MLDVDSIKKLLRQIENTQAEEFDCQHAMGSLDIYVDRIFAGEPREEIMPLVRHHLERCGACNEACALLLRMLEDAPTA